MCVYSKRLSAQECLEHAWLRQEQDICQHVTSSTVADQSESESADNTDNTANTSAAELETKPIHQESSSSSDENELLVSKSAITCITLELVSEKLDVIQEHHSEKKSDSPAAARDEKCSVHISEQDRDLLLAATSGESSENSQPDSCETCSDNRDNMTSSLSTGVDTAAQRKIFKELTNQRAAAVVASPLASPIGCRRQLTSSPETITEIEPVKKHHCRRDAQQLSLIMNSSSDLHVHVKVESKVWDLDDVVLEDNSAIVTKREKEIVVTS